MCISISIQKNARIRLDFHFLHRLTRTLAFKEKNNHGDTFWCAVLRPDPKLLNV